MHKTAEVMLSSRFNVQMAPELRRQALGWRGKVKLPRDYVATDARVCVQCSTARGNIVLAVRILSEKKFKLSIIKN